MSFESQTLKSLLQSVAVTAALGLAASAQAQTVLKFGYAVAKDSHYGVGVGVFCAEIEKGTQGRYKCQEFPSGSSGASAR
jgi:TRAP-type C4-dicarboxylate transport system substrate-binding protein